MTGRITGFLAGMIQALCFCNVCFAYTLQTGDESPILIISSYNPDAYSTSTNISEFIEEYDRLGGVATVFIENMNCLSFSESLLWKARMKEILSKYRGNNRPGCIILLGQEAWASYLSQDDSITSNIPVFSAMASKNAVILPDSNVVSLKEWTPQSIDFVSNPSTVHIQGGFLYEYDVESNINLIRKLYPDTRNIAFISDNTYGGVAIQARVRKEMEKFPDLNLILLDGRKLSIYTMIEALSALPPNTVLLLGTWRVDENDGYFMQSATYSMMETVSSIPVFSLTSLGFGYWTLGGYMPNYRNFGGDMAQQVINVLSESDTENRPTIISNRLQMDHERMNELGIDRKLLPDDVKLINVPPTFYRQYRYQIWAIIAVVAILSTALVFALFFYARTKRLKDHLEISEARLRAAKEHAEQSNRMKSAFLANMSHEIRTPLNAIVGFSNILATRELPPNKREMICGTIQNSSSLLLRLINDILDLSKLEAERMVFTWTDCDIVQLTRRVVSTMEQTAANSNRYIFNPRFDSYVLRTDEQRFQQVLINLLSNAAKFTKNGTITLDFTADTAAETVTFSVTDTGCGIPPEKRNAVFDRFEKLDNFAQGTGLGLSICVQITAKWGGRIWVDPVYNAGARFVFTHPVHAPSDRKNNAHEPEK